MDIYAISKTVRRRLKEKIRGKTRYGNVEWKNANFKWYSKIHDDNFLLHQDFMRYLKGKKDIKTVLEAGCGAGVYAIRHKDLFNGLSYTGLDISNEAIEYCKKNSNFNFICGDLIKMEITEKNKGDYLGFIDGETAIFINEKNYQDKFEEFLRDHDNPKWERIANAGRKYALTNFNNDKAVNTLVDLMEELI